MVSDGVKSPKPPRKLVPILSNPLDLFASPHEVFSQGKASTLVMSGFSEGDEPKSTPKCSSGGSNQVGSASCIPEQDSSQTKTPKASSWLFTTRFSVFNTTSSASPAKKEVKAKIYWWITSIRKAMNGGLMRWLQERMLGNGKMDVSSSTSEIWLLGACYKVSPEEPPNDENLKNSLSAFQEDFTTKIWITYRKGFAAIGDSKFTSDVNWGCMIRSSQMLVAQALIFHYLGRSWRNTQKPYDPKYIELLHHFGDSKDSAYSIHNLLLAGKGYGLAAGCWVGPYAMCRSWEVLSNSNEESSDTAPKKQRFPLTVHIVSGDENGERGGAPVVHVDVACKLSLASNNGEPNWSPMLLLVPLVLGLGKINPRYIPLLWATFTFPQSLGILGGKPGASTYIVGVRDDKALYLDPHEVQQVINISGCNLEADTSSYHCSTMKSLPLEQIDPSLAIGFYCRDKDDFDDFCSRATKLAEKSNGAPLFTVNRSQQMPKKNHQADDPGNTSSESHDNGSGNVSSYSDIHQSEDEWQLL